MALILKDRVLESSTSSGTGSFTLTGAQTGYQSFTAIGNGNTTYYTIQGKNSDGTLTGEWEVGTGTWSTGGTLARDTVLSNSLGTTALINFSAGTKDVFVTYPSDKAILGTTSAVASTGTGSVVLNSNPSFATDITVNGLTVGRGDGNIATNTAFGNDAIGSPYITSVNTNNVGIGYNALNTIGAGVGSLTVLTGGSYPILGTDVYEVTLIYVSGTPIIAGGVYPIVEIQTIDGVVTNINSIIDAGYGWSATDTVFTIDPIVYSGSGFTCQIASLLASTNNTALGYNAGSTNKTGSDSVYLGSGASGTGTNEIAIGANAVGGGNNTIVIGNNNTTTTTILGATQFFSLLTATGGLSANGVVTLTGNTTSTMSIGTGLTTGTILIGRTTGTGAITLGQSTGTQTVNVATGANNLSAKTVNIGTGATNGATTITLGSTGTVTGATTINIGTQARTSGITTVNIGTSATGGNSNINLGSSISGSTTTVRSNSFTTTSTTLSTFNNSITVNAPIIQQTKTVGTLPSLSLVAGMRFFVTDALAPTFGADVVGSGAVGVPVYYDGTSWKVG